MKWGITSIIEIVIHLAMHKKNEEPSTGGMMT
jgi:hypothetical protein